MRMDGVMAAQQCEYMSYHRAVHLEMVKGMFSHNKIFLKVGP